MIRATTPTFIFRLPIDCSKITKAEVTLSQSGENKLTKQTEDCLMNDKKLTVTLSQEETLLFSDKADVQTQLRILTSDGKVFASQVFSVPVIDSLSEEVLRNDV